MSNVIQFPSKSNIPQTVEEVQNIVKTNKINSANEIVDTIFHNILHDMDEFGFDVDADRIHHKDLLMLGEVLKATIYRHIGEPHFLHETIENSIDLNDVPPQQDIDTE